jgi:ribonuclease BN (tRNA processing enzyme)
MKILALGTGTCASNLPNIVNREPPGFLVTVGDTQILFDCSEGMRFRLEKVGVEYSGIHHIAISHVHPDHFALIQFIQSMFFRRQLLADKFDPTLNIYCPDTIANEFDTYWNFHLREWPDKFPTVKLVFHPMSGKDKAFQIGEVKLSAASVYHGFGKVDALAYRVEAFEGIFAYSGDSGQCEGLDIVSKNADIFLCEASARIGDFTNAMKYGHLNPFHAGEVALKNDVKKLILTHYTGLDKDAEMIAEAKRAGYKKEVIIAKDFREYSI